jgi:hypothetical protein
MKYLALWAHFFLCCGLCGRAASALEKIELFPLTEDLATDGLTQRGDASLSGGASIRVAIMGKVPNPGWYYFTGDFTPLMAIDAAGGFAPGAAKYLLTVGNNIKRERWVFRNYGQDGGPPVNSLGSWKLREGDIIFVHELIK